MLIFLAKSRWNSSSPGNSPQQFVLQSKSNLTLTLLLTLELQSIRLDFYPLIWTYVWNIQKNQGYLEHLDKNYWYFLQNPLHFFCIAWNRSGNNLWCYKWLYNHWVLIFSWWGVAATFEIWLRSKGECQSVDHKNDILIAVFWTTIYCTNEQKKAEFEMKVLKCIRS